MRAEGSKKVKPFQGGNNKQRNHLNELVDDHVDLVMDVEWLFNNRDHQQQGGIQITCVGVVNDEVTLVYVDVVGTLVGTVAEVDG